MTRLLIPALATVLLASSGCCKSNTEEGPSAGPSPTPATTATPKRFEGTYSSNWGTTTFTESGATVSAKYPRGTMTCTALGEVLNCDWFEGGARGKALLTRQPNGDIKGTWGKGTSATNGGPWTFKKVVAK